MCDEDDLIDIYDHLDSMNDLIHSATNENDIYRDITDYCRTYDLDPDGFEVLESEEGAFEIEIACGD